MVGHLPGDVGGVAPAKRQELAELLRRQPVDELVRRGIEFDALFAASDISAIGAMHALQKLGRAIPEDVAVVGFDDIPAASLSSPPLTTVRQNTRTAGEALVEALIEAVEAGSTPSRLLPVELIVRESSSG